MRIAICQVSAEAARKADLEFAKHAKGRAIAKSGPSRIRMSCESAAVRKIWMDQYVKAGGEIVEICGERVAPPAADPVIAQIVDRVFSSRHPELGGRELSFGADDKKMRAEWMDLYEEFGGRTARFCEPHQCPEST